MIELIKSKECHLRDELIKKIQTTCMSHLEKDGPAVVFSALMLAVISLAVKSYGLEDGTNLIYAVVDDAKRTWSNKK